MTVHSGGQIPTLTNVYTKIISTHIQSDRYRHTCISRQHIDVSPLLLSTFVSFLPPSFRRCGGRISEAHDARQGNSCFCGSGESS